MCSHRQGLQNRRCARTDRGSGDATPPSNDEAARPSSDSRRPASGEGVHPPEGVSNKAHEEELRFLRNKIVTLEKSSKCLSTIGAALENIQLRLDEMEAGNHDLVIQATGRGVQEEARASEIQSDSTDDEVMPKPPSVRRRTMEAQVESTQHTSNKKKAAPSYYSPPFSSHRDKKRSGWLSVGLVLRRRL